MKSTKGKLYGIGVGVGDPENITLKAIKVLRDIDVIVLPEAKTGEGSTAFDIVKEYIKEDVEQIFLEFPMIKELETRKIFRKNTTFCVKIFKIAGTFCSNFMLKFSEKYYRISNRK